MKKLSLLCLCLVLVSGCASPIVTLQAQSLPVTKTLAWDPNPPSDQVTSYTVSLDGNVIGSPTGTTQAVVFASAGTHTLTVTATNAWGGSLPASLSVNVVVPGKPTNLKVQ